jgi:plastocyanin
VIEMLDHRGMPHHHRWKMTLRAVALGAVVVLALSACAEEPRGRPTGSAATEEPTTEEPTEDEGTEQEEGEIPEDCFDEREGINVPLVAEDFSFDPPCTVAIGAQGVILDNAGSATHNLTVEGTSIDEDVDPGAQIEAGPLNLEPGTHRFFCRFHEAQGMEGQLVVTEVPPGEEAEV